MPQNHDHELDIDSDGGRVDYHFEAVGNVFDVSLEDHDDYNMDDHTVTGHCNGGTDTIGFNTAPKGIRFDGGFQHASLRLDGRPVEPFHINMRKLEIHADAPSDTWVPYRFAVKGRIIGTGGTEGQDQIHADGTRADGAMWGGNKDVWNFWGSLIYPDSNHDLTVVVDEKEIPIEGNPPVGVL